MVIGFCGCLQGDKVFLIYLKGILKLWEETRKKKDLSHIMVTLNRQLMGDTREKWNMFMLEDTT